MLPIQQQLAEKLHASLREYADGTSSRPKDAFDTVVTVALIAVPHADVLREAVRSTFALRDTPMPSGAPHLPPEWHADLGGYLDEFPVAVAASPARLLERFVDFWNPVLTGDGSATWSPERWSWMPGA